jgi:UDP-N-acetylmuramate--alanine ligase
MIIKDLKRIYFLGIGGIGMSALARYFRSKGAEIHGYDKTSTLLTAELEKEGMMLHYEENPDLIPEGVDLVIHTPAVPTEHAEYRYFQARAIPVRKRAEVLGMITREMKTVAVAGTHGKTSISTMITHLLLSAGYPVNAFLGGISVNYGTNLHLDPEAQWVVTEADEYDRSFLQLFPDIAVISAMDADHLDIYGTKESMRDAFVAFTGQIRQGGLLVCHHSLKDEWGGRKDVISYGIGAGDVSARQVEVRNGRFRFTLRAGGEEFPGMEMGVPGRHNIENALAASAVALQLGLSPAQIAEALLTCRGVKRRFEIHLDLPQLKYVDDYAHHPEEIRACLEAVKELWPGMPVTAIFQPHLFTRTRDFAAGFSAALSVADELILLPVYPARELPLPGVDSGLILRGATLDRKHLVEKDDLSAKFSGFSKGVVVSMGAGDIDTLVGPLAALLNENARKEEGS